MAFRGVYRIKNQHEDSVWITDGTAGLQISESRYRDRGYQPPVESLPWRSPTTPPDGGTTDH
jgi:hypothetical protein